LANGAQFLRPNPARSVEVFGEFNEELACRVCSNITRLRAEGREPITVYINSNGGGIRELDIIEGILRSEDLDRHPCFFVTVALGNALSAGANLLTFGQYAYAHEHSVVHFHGARSSDLPDAFEDAAQMATSLQKLNRDLSQRLAAGVIQRLVFRYQSRQPHFSTLKKAEKGKSPPEFIDLIRFLRSIRRWLSPPARRVVETTLGKILSAKTLSDSILPRVIPKLGKRTNFAADDAKVLIGVVKHELRQNAGKPWRLDERGVEQIVSDYFLLRDYSLGDHTALVKDLLDVYGPDFLTANEIKSFQQIKEDDTKKRLSFLREHAEPKLSPLWYFAVSLCRQLMLGENRLTPQDAYYLGLIDEVIGTNMTGRRVVVEQQSEEPPDVEAEQQP
jgi:ATP-dependent protease ClpP protease subunit